MEQISIKKDFIQEALKFGVINLDDTREVLKKTQEFLTSQQQEKAFELSNLWKEYENSKAA